MGRRRRASRHHGVLVVDKKRGPTSHDVVGRLRRVFDTGAVGHAGTLDPMATGVLVVAVGEATKLVAHLTAADKEYEATVALGVATDTLDAEGREVRRADVPPLTREQAEAAARAFLGAGKQRPPKVSAIKVGGRPLHERVRRGEEVEVPERDVFVHSLEILAFRPDAIDLRVCADKGFYVRSLGRDLAEALGTVGHLSALRRLRSGHFDVSTAIDMARVEAAAAGDPDALRAVTGALVPMTEAWSGPTVVLDDAGCEDARHGRVVMPERCGPMAGEASTGDVVAMLDAQGELVALGELAEDDTLRVRRGFASTGGEAEGTFPA